MPTHPTAYETDFYAWTQEQARLLDARQFDALDIPNLVEEITSLGKSEQRELYHRLRTLVEHLLKLALVAQHQQFPLITCESSVPMASDSALSILPIHCCLLKRLPRSDIPGDLVASRLIS